MIRILGHHALLGVRSRGDYIRFPYFTFPPPVYFSGEEDNAVQSTHPFTSNTPLPYSFDRYLAIDGRDGNR